jgi:hypothetical protein
VHALIFSSRSSVTVRSNTHRISRCKITETNCTTLLWLHERNDRKLQLKIPNICNDLELSN